ncbi:hypothetical protein BJ875DRAFT_35200 [Amylocarpus encephaloides]|uniref:SH3 domain-containing protein n=1 Tax=Amylocarpus encephaloides TaxID=45428 RepID=A0A9P7YHU2_9HELO|nr:hypothetical protein BJ875DRAFT_35200 [Amylocarpus encephaloides]
MTRPEIIRADSIDLQDQNSPSAQDHSRKPAIVAPLGAGAPAPHQAEALREVAAEAAEQNGRSPRVSKEWTSGEVQQMQSYEEDLVAGVTSRLNGNSRQQQDDLAVAQNGGMTGSTAEDAEMADAEGDDGMDDDMMDKISSSPSIDDGGYSLSKLWPMRSTSLLCEPATPPSSSQACGKSSSPAVIMPDHLLRQKKGSQGDDECGQDIQNHHLQSEYLGDTDDNDPDLSDYDHPNVEIGPPSPLLIQQTSPYHLGAGDPFSDDPVEDVFTMETSQSGFEVGDGMMMPYEDSEDDDFEIAYHINSRFIDSGWGGECLHQTEDIDFEFVYALHTFVATVEGQANATKGDTMVLLDDSNSYWWLVRVVKDSSIGYLPAEHIETPTERLARLNKHRNIDLTSAMLGDQAEKSKNPLKKAIRRRNAKTVAFAAPTYVEASDIEYSTDEEEAEGDYFSQNGEQDKDADQQEAGGEEDDVNTVEPLKPRNEIREARTDLTEPDAKAGDPTSDSTIAAAARTSDDMFDGKTESKSRNGTVRNTDSFFKDDSVETRKITLTPNLLRDDSSTSTRTSNDSKEFSKRPSLDKLDKDSVSEKTKDKKDKKDKKEKEKKPGMLSGLFKRKEKKSKAIEDEVEDIMAGKQSAENSRGSPVPSKDSDDISYADEPSQATSADVQRQPSKLQKQPRTDMSPNQKGAAGKDARPSDQPQQAPAPERPPPADSAQTPSMRLVQAEPDVAAQQPRESSPELSRNPAPIITATKEQKPAGTISKILRSASGSNSDPKATKPVKARKAKARVELDDFDSSPESSPIEESERAPSKQPRPIPGSFPDSYISTNSRSNAADDRLSESPVQVSPITPSQSYPPPLMVDHSSQDEAPSPQSSPSPELLDAEDVQDKKEAGSSSTSRSTPTWSDSHLRTFFDDDADIKDLLVVVYDKSGVVPAGPDHPITGNLFRDENAKLADITNRLDGMLGDWLARKMRAQG